MKNKYLAIIPARYASSRFPGKPLARLGGREVILRVTDRVAEAGIEPIVATDDERILNCVLDAGRKAVMTRSDHVCGTDRVREAYDICTAGRDSAETDKDIIINVQGDEPFIRPAQLGALIDLFERYDDTDIATLARRIQPGTPYRTLADPNVVKVVVGTQGRALYFSRSVIPYLRNADKEEWSNRHAYLFHIGIYAYKASVLRAITRMSVSPLEKAESLEQLRWLEAGLSIRIAETETATIGIDTPEDLRAAEEYLASGLR